MFGKIQKSEHITSKLFLFGVVIKCGYQNDDDYRH